MTSGRRLAQAASGSTLSDGGILLWRDTPDSAVGTVVTAGSDGSVALENWQTTPWNIYGGASVQVVADATKGKAISFFGAANQYGQPVANYGGYQNQRGEQSPIFEVQESQTLWLGFDMWVSSGVGQSTGWQDFFQLKNDTEGSPSLALGVNEASYGDGASIHLVSAIGPNGTPNQVYSLGPTPADVWVRLVIGMHVTKSGSSSWVEAWRDGSVVLPRTAWATYNQAAGGPGGGLLYSDAASGYYKFGVYRSPAEWDVEYRLANIKLGTTLGSVSG